MIKWTRRLEAYLAGRKAILKDINTNNQDKAIGSIRLIQDFHDSNHYMRKSENKEKAESKTKTKSK